MNKNTIDIINKAVRAGFKFFYFDRRSFKLVASNRGNEGSFYDLPISDTIELCITKETTSDYVDSRLKYYNAII